MLLSYLLSFYRKKNLQDLRQITLWIIAGFLILSIPCILYFVSKGTLADMYDAYFYTNLFQYGGAAANGEPTAPWFFLVKLAITVALVLPIAFTKVRRDVRLLIVTCFGLQMLSFTLWSVNIYYFLVLFAYAPLAIYFLRNVRATRTAKTLLLLVGTLATATSYNFDVQLTRDRHIPACRRPAPQSLLLCTECDQARDKGRTGRMYPNP